MKRQWLSFIALTIAVLLVACTKGDPPCPAGSKDVYLQEADAALSKRAHRLMEEANSLMAQGKTAEAAELGTRRAMTFTCGYDLKSDGMYRTVDKVDLTISHIAQCLTDPGFSGVPLHVCALAIARTLFITEKMLGDKDADLRIALQLASKVVCLELSRDVDVEPEKHGLERRGPGWVEITIFAVVQALEAGAEAVTAPAMFIIIPDRSGGEEACVDPTTNAPPKRCAANGDCPNQPPGATPAPTSSGSGGDIIPPGGTPGTSGDYP